MSLWKSPLSLEEINRMGAKSLVAHLGIRFTEIGDDYLVATMPVDERTHQPMGILHGGASVSLAETLGSTAAQFAAGPGHYCVGLDINANHLRSVRRGLVTAVAKPMHIGRSTQVWEIILTDEDGHKVCVSRLTMAVLSSTARG